MQESTSLETVDLSELVAAYIAAIEERDLDRCSGLYAEDARLVFMTGVFKGRVEISQWHKERFEAGLEVVRVDGVRVKGDVVTVDASVTSRKLKAWHIGNLSGRATLRFEGGRIKEIKFGLRNNPLEGW